MMFLNTETYEIEEFGSEDPPSYVILSHTWLRKRKEDPKIESKIVGELT